MQQRKRDVPWRDIVAATAIVGVVAALMAPAHGQFLSRLFGRRDQQKCLTNGKMLSLAMVQYIQDTDEFFSAERPWVEPRLGGPDLSLHQIDGRPAMPTRRDDRG